MDITLSEEQELYRRAVKNLLQREHPTSEVRAAETSEFGYLSALYRRFGDLGYLGLPIPEEHGGSGGTWLTASPSSTRRSIAAFRSSLFQ